MCDEVNAFDSRASRRTALCASWEATTARASTSDTNFQSAPAGERLSVALFLLPRQARLDGQQPVLPAQDARARRARQRSPPSTSPPAGRSPATLMATSARLLTAALTALATAEAAASADSCGAVVAAERVGEGVGPVPWPAQAAQRARGWPGRCLATRVTGLPCAELRSIGPTLE